MNDFGKFIRDKRKTLLKDDPSFSQQQLSEKIGIKQSYLSKIERGTATKLAEEKIIALAEALNEDPDYLLALGGKVSSDVLGILQKRPRLFSRLVRQMKNMPEDVIEADHNFRQRQSRISRLYELANIAFLHLEATPDDSAWSSLTPHLLNLPNDATPRLESISGALHQASREFFLSIEHDAYRKREPYFCELRLKNDNAPIRFINLWGDYEVSAENGEVIRIGLIQDVTKTVLVRKELNKAKEALSGTVELQSQQVAQGIDKLKKEIAARKILEAELRDMNAEVARKNDTQRGFLKRSAYRLRSLVNRLAMEEDGRKSPEDSAKLLSQISTAINNMNDFFAIEDGVSPLHDTFDTEKFFESIYADIDAPESSIPTHLNMSPNLPDKIVADQQRLEQIVHSIMDYLLHNTLWGSIQTNIDYLPKEKAMVLAFSSSATHERVNKEYFYPLGNMTTNTMSWTLATVGPIVDGLRGTLDAKPTPSNGVDILIQLPVSPADGDTQAIDRKQTVLVVEDDEFSRLYTERAVEKLGFAVESVALGKEAISKANARQYGLILLDIQLPDADGVTVAKEIRNENGPNASTRIIAVTAHATPEDRHRYAEAGIDHFIAKPFKIKTLTQIIGSAPALQKPKK